MFERFTDKARRVIVLAQEEARTLSHNYIGTEHVLLGLISEGDGIAAQALESLDITLERAREGVAELIGRGQNATSGHIPFTPRAKKVLELCSARLFSLVTITLALSIYSLGFFMRVRVSLHRYW